MFLPVSSSVQSLAFARFSREIRVVCCLALVMTLTASHQHLLAAGVDAFWSAVSITARRDDESAGDKSLKDSSLSVVESQLKLLAFRLHNEPAWFERRGRDGEYG